jgi:Fe-Mn family superoxide dismutase
MKRRQFLQAGAFVGMASAGILSALPVSAADEAFVQPPLPYGLDGLKPFMSEEQMNFHYNKHHAGYYANLKKLVDGKPEAQWSLDDIVIKSEPGPVFNNAAQAWNHAFFWNCLAPVRKEGRPNVQNVQKLFAAIDRDFGGLAQFKEQFVAKATALFGSGWCWLAADKDGKLDILPLSNAGNPLKQGLKPLLVVDVWEHAYYIDYRNERGKFLKTFVEHIDWGFVSKNYG